MTPGKYDDVHYTVGRKDDRGHYEVTKWGSRPEPLDAYDVTIPPPNSTAGVYCNCQGFRRQSYTKEKHKHVMLVRKFIADGEPEGRVYAIDGKNPLYVIRIAKDNLFSV